MANRCHAAWQFLTVRMASSNLENALQEREKTVTRAAGLLMHTDTMKLNLPFEVLEISRSGFAIRAVFTEI
jgi:hypothetical protein